MFSCVFSQTIKVLCCGAAPKFLTCYIKASGMKLHVILLMGWGKRHVMQKEVK